MSKKNKNDKDNITPITPVNEKGEKKEPVNSALKSSQHGEKKSGSSRYMVVCLIAAIAFIAMACGFFYAQDRSKKDVGDAKPAMQTEVKKEVSLVTESTEAQRILDNILLKKNNWQLKEDEHGLKEITVPGVEAKVKINQRELNVGVPATTSLAAAGDWLKEKIEAQGLVYLGGESCNYRRWDGYKSRVGIKTKAGDGTRNFLTDTIVFFHNTNLIKEDKDVKEKKIQPVASRKYKGKVAIVIDDCGQTLEPLKTLLDTNLPFSYAILPNKVHSADALSLIKQKGRVAMLHLPMEAMGNAPAEDITVKVNDGPQEQAAKTRKLVASLPGIVGVNNHQGSKATSDRETMKAVLKELKAKGMFFIDSFTSTQSVARDTARSMNVSTARNDIFLDNEADIEYIRKKIYEAFARAERNGSCIAICHARPQTAACWEKYKDEFKATGIEFVSVTSLLY
ncbi:MAG: divergent polysaccharide deacetylase family protein [Phascolarctobacterium sp.]|nr:divergent polysaccharide deacetylase family protein [Phascolarctobacterium sp.]